MTTTVQATDQPTFTITEEIFVQASIDTTFASIVTQLGRQNEGLDGKPMPMIFEAKPGGRWYRDLGEDNGHFWGFVQSIKRPSLIEIWGPMFMSTATTNNVIYRLSEKDGGTLITFKHTMVGPVPNEFRANTKSGWVNIHARIKRHAEAGAA
jgi:hypothetical protein